MNQLIINDNSRITEDALGVVPDIVSKVANVTLEDLASMGLFIFPELFNDSEDLTREQMVLQSEGKIYRSGNVMGFLGCGNQRMNIKSRFSTENDDYFLAYLLEKVISIPNIVNCDADISKENKLMELFPFLFPNYLRKAIRKGIFKTYVTRQYNNVSPKGTVDIPRHIKLNTPFVGKIAYNQRENSYDNYMTQLVRHTIEFIKRQSYGNAILPLVRDEIKIIEEVTPSYKPGDVFDIIRVNQKNVVRHAYYKEYRELQRLCLLILQQRKNQVGTGSTQLYGILFDGAWLWEEYVNTLIEDMFYHPMNKAKSELQILFSHGQGHIYPDFIGKNRQERIIADAKYKPINNINNKDYFQVMAYMLRFDAKKGFFLYPENGLIENERMYLNKGLTYEKNVEPRDDIYLMKHGFKIPCNATSYEDFSEKMAAAEQEFRRVLSLC